MPSSSSTGRLATSKASVCEDCAVHRADEANSWAVTSMVSATVVVTLGASKVVVAVVMFEPALTLIGFVLSTPEKAMMPPALPSFVPSVNV